DSVPSRLVLTVPLLAVVLERELLARRSLQQHFARGRGQVPPGGVQVELERARQTRKDHLAEVPSRLTPRQHHPLEKRETRIAEHELGVHLAAGAQPGAIRTRAERRVEGELTRLELGQRQPALWA